MSGGLAVDPEGFERRLAEHVEWLRISHFSEATAEAREKYLGYLGSWCQERGITRPSEVTKAVLERYQGHLYRRRKANGEPLSIVTQQNHLLALRGFFRWLARTNRILYNPASELVLPRLAKRLPRHVLSAEEAERVLGVPDVRTALGLRDRAILETLYSSGLRRMELVGLRLYDLDAERRTLMIREGKGRKQRVVPIGERALKWVERYVREVRPELVVTPDEGVLFLTHHGRAFEKSSLTEMVRVYVRDAEVGKRGSVHLFRHTMATLMLEGGADVRYVQAMLGHSRLETTALYTQVAAKKLREVHARSHPAGLRSAP